MENDIEKTIRSLCENGSFGDVKFLKMEKDDGMSAIQCCSSLVFGKLTVEGQSGEEMMHLVIKLARAPELIRFFDSQAQFHNEAIMYTKVLSALGADPNSYPKLYYQNVSFSQEINRYMIILENLHYKGFTGCTHSVFLDYDHISAAIKKIAQFHSLSYILKHENRTKFIELTKMFRKSKFGMLPWDSEEYDSVKHCYYIPTERAVKAFVKTTGNDDEILVKFLAKVRDQREATRKLPSPEEHFGVICHGDFTNYNILLKHDDRGNISDVAMFDFQASCYGSIAVDLSLFLFTHTDVDMRRKHWDEFLKIYYDALENSVGNSVKIPKFAELLDHFAKRATYGFIMSCLFLPIVMNRAGTGENIWWKMGPEEIEEWLKSIGGESTDQFLTDYFSHFYKIGYVNSFMEYAREINL